MKTVISTTIYLLGLSFDKPEKVEAFKGTEIELTARLKELQSGYCEDEKPRIHKQKTDSGKTFIECMSDSDYFYAARVR